MIDLGHLFDTESAVYTLQQRPNHRQISPSRIININMVDQLKLYLFGDQTYDTQSHLRELMLYRHNPVLEDFLVKVYDTIRTEIYKLPAEIRDDLPRFTCLDDLVLWKQDGKRCIALDMAVTCMYQLGVFIR